MPFVNFSFSVACLSMYECLSVSLVQPNDFARFVPNHPTHVEAHVHQECSADTGHKALCPVSRAAVFVALVGISRAHREECDRVPLNEMRLCPLLPRGLMPGVKQSIDLLFLEDEEGNSHYCWIKQFSRFARHSTEKGQGKMEYCRFCLQRFSTTYKGKTAEHLTEASATCFDVKWVCVDNEELNGLLENVNGSSRFAMMMCEWEHELD